MQLQRIKFKEFSGPTATLVAKTANPFLPGGRFRGEAPPPPPAPTFSEAEFKAAEREAYKKGFLEGTAEGTNQQKRAQDEVEQKLLACVEGFAATTAPFISDYRNMVMQLKAEMPKIALAIARKAAGAALNANAQAAVEETALRCVEAMISEPGLIVSVHESIAESLEQKIALMTAKMQTAADITVMRDPNINVADCKVEWKNGAFTRDTAKMWQDLERAIETMTASVAYDTKTHLDTLQATPPASETPTKE